ncbi:MAG TPA: MBL fold metallo-hydrolase [Acidimicrobiia bacterium]|nr:MBL fold metallo-hydrolase [Acidimicrobiia bacterium]
MTAHTVISRRLLLKDMGKAGLAVIVFGTAACSNQPTSNATPTEEPGSTSTLQPETTTTDPVTASSADSSTTVSAGHRWHRANLGFVSAYILYRNGEAALVDTGVGGSDTAIEVALGEVGLTWDAVGHLVVTHKHPDHQGSVEAVINAASAPWYAGVDDIDQITASTEGSAIGDGDEVFGLTIIETPGHTPGHISVLDPVSGILVAGDALNGAESGGVGGPRPDFSEDIDQANASVAKLAGFDYEVALFGHGEPVLEGASELVIELADSLGGG